MDYFPKKWIKLPDAKKACSNWFTSIYRTNSRRKGGKIGKGLSLSTFSNWSEVKGSTMIRYANLMWESDFALAPAGKENSPFLVVPSRMHQLLLCPWIWTLKSWRGRCILRMLSAFTFLNDRIQSVKRKIFTLVSECHCTKWIALKIK